MAKQNPINRVQVFAANLSPKPKTEPLHMVTDANAAILALSDDIRGEIYDLQCKQLLPVKH